MTELKTRKGITTIKFAQDTYILRRVLSIIILIIIISSNVLLITHIGLIFYSLTKLKIEPENFETYTPDNETIIFEGDISITTEMDIKDFILNLSLYTDSEMLLIDESFTEELIKKGEKSSLFFQFVFEFVEMDIEDFLSLNETESLIFDIYATLNYGGIIFEIEFEIEQDIEAIF